ncbi:MAG TPA: ABC transporter permease [Candidatus Pullichristensenella excrementipullorum]|nr:ABC transporter permease [Candidatus Pullichristensenella excrementipullorum]
MGIGAKLSAAYRRDRHIARLILMMVVWAVFMAITRFDKFYTLINFQTMASQFPEFGLMSLGIMVCMITGGIDLSTVGVANLVSICTATLMKAVATEENEIAVYVIPLCFVIAILMGAAAGAFNGFLVSRVRIPPILATLGTSELFTGIGIVITDGKAVSKLPRMYSSAINSKIFGLIPTQLVFFAVMALVIWFLLMRTTYGTKIYMIGTSSKAAVFSGIRTNLLLVKTYMISGICAALGGMVMLANYNSARADYGTVYTLQCVLIVVLGGVNPNGGSGKVSGVVLAICLLQMLQTGINRFPQISSYYISLIWGGVLILVMVLNYFTEHNIHLIKSRRS